MLRLLAGATVASVKIAAQNCIAAYDKDLITATNNAKASANYASDLTGIGG
jgi:hypothetical protein